MSQPDDSLSSFSISPFKCSSILSGPCEVHVSFTCPLCGNLFMGEPPVRKALTCEGNHASNCGVDALKGKLNMDSLALKPLSSFENTSIHRMTKLFASSKGIASL